MTDVQSALLKSVLVFISGMLILATKMLPVSEALMPWLLFGSAGIDLALGIFFAQAAVKAYRIQKAK